MLPWERKNIVEWEYFGTISDYTLKENVIDFKLDKGLMRIKVLTSNIIRVTFIIKDAFLNIPSIAVVDEPCYKDFSVAQNEDEIVVNTKELDINISMKNGKIVIKNRKGEVISEDISHGFEWSKDTIKCLKAIKDADHFYGLGEKTGLLDKKGRKYTMWNTDESDHTPSKDPLYKSIPFLITFNENYTYGILVDKTCRTWFDLGEEDSGYFTFEADDFEMDYYFIYGADIKKVVSDYSNLTGKIYLPPLWALGYQQCRWGYYPDEKVKMIADTFREKKIPCDAIYLDIDYMDGYRNFTWDAEKFPDPKAMMKDLKEKGFKVVTIIDPGVKKDRKYKVYREGKKQKLFCKNALGLDYHGFVWPGIVAFPDFTKEKTRKWWGEKHDTLFDDGVSGIWNDMNEPSVFYSYCPDKTLATISNKIILENDGYPGTFRRYHNLYATNMCRATYEGFKKLKPDERPFILTRGAYAGIQRYAAVWTGDNSSWWESMAMAMPMLMNIGLSGLPFVGGDVGGFSENATPELFARWMQLGVFTPFFRAHSRSNTKPHEPWAFGTEVEDICRKYIELRYSLLPYNYNEFYNASKTGLPIMRPLVMEYPEDENVHALCDQFMYGESIMLAPVIRPTVIKRCVYIPEGTWYNYWSGEKYEGKDYIMVDAPLDVLPMFIKAGSIIPTIPVMNYTGEKEVDVLTLDIYAGNDIRYSLYEDDGISNKYKEGIYSITGFELQNTVKGLKVSIIPEVKNYIPGRSKYAFRIHSMGKPPIGINDTTDVVFDYDKIKDILSFYVDDENTVKKNICINY
jgi:alpha-glucosidase